MATKINQTNRKQLRSDNQYVKKRSCSLQFSVSKSVQSNMPIKTQLKFNV